MSGVLGTTPQAKKNKTFAGVEYRSPKKGEVFFNESTWRTAKSDYHATSHPVAIYEDTNRPDGTPMEDCEALPTVKGHRVEWYGRQLLCHDMGDATGYVFHNGIKWLIWEDEDTPSGAVTGYYGLLFKIAKPTTLEDLVGEDGQKAVWLIAEDGQVCSCHVSIFHKEINLCGGDLKWWAIKDLLDSHWSHSPFIAYADANKFVVGGSNE